MSQSMYRRRRGWRTVASTLALTLGSLAIPAAALADGLIDPNFNGTGYAVGPAFSGQDNRVPMVIEPDGKIVVGGSAGGAMTLIRYNLDGSVDSTFGNGGVAQRQITGTPNGAPGTSGATAMTLDTNGTILVAGLSKGAYATAMISLAALGLGGLAAAALLPRETGTGNPRASRSETLRGTE